ncbi:hypothetical protein HY970_04100 [Candidatus Kaiserbacteria bacterium]|nr:hypothetical protein [Candidatus Kaiserbacteria bacterium]
MQLIGNVQLVRGSADTLDFVINHLEKIGYEIRGNPDAYIRSYAHFGIDEARELRDRSSTKALGEGNRMFIIAAPSLTNEAQNALLKTFEEPAGNALFVLITPSPDSLLATLRSRAQIWTILATESQSKGVVDPAKFLTSQPAARIEMIKPLLEKGDDPSTPLGAGKRDIASIITFLSSLELMLERHMHESGTAAGLESIYRARRYIADKGSLVKALLEQVALLVPVMK